jgi:hypothetical protein
MDCNASYKNEKKTNPLLPRLQKSLSSKTGKNCHHLVPSKNKMITTIFTKVQRDTHCTKNCTAGHREGYTCTKEQVHGGEGYTLNVHIAVNMREIQKKDTPSRPHCRR